MKFVSFAVVVFLLVVVESFPDKLCFGVVGDFVDGSGLCVV
jgi:hypothetical protein